MFDLYSDWHSHIFDPDRIPYALGAMLVTAIIGMISGPLGGNANPFFWYLIDKIFGGLGDRLDRAQRKSSDLMFRGFILMTFTLFFSMLAAEITRRFGMAYPLGGFSQSIVLSLCITSGAVWFALLKLYFALEQKKMGTGAYYAISRSTRMNLATADDHGITRIAMNFTAQSFDKGMVAPVFWYLVGGFPALFAYAALSALCWRFAKQGFTKGFGAVPLAIEKLLGFIPSLYAALLITLASLFTPTAKLHKGIASWMTVKGRTPYEQGGFPLTAMAWALNVTLGGAGQDLQGSAIKSAWAGPEGASAQISHKHLRQAIYISVLAHLLFVGSLLGAYVWGGIH